MSITSSSHRGYPLPGATINDKRLDDMQAIKAALIAVDADLANSQVSAIPTSALGAANGVATLDASGLIPSTQLPSYVDDVVEGANLAAFPAVGETGKIYVAKDTNKPYRWSGSAYIFITSGAVDSVAGKTGVVVLAKADVGLANVDNTSDMNKPVSTAQAVAIAAVNYALPVASNTVLGGVKVDGTSVTISSGVISSVTAPATSLAAVTNWAGLPWDIMGTSFGVPTASQVDIRFSVGRAFVLPANLAGSIVNAGVVATAIAVWNIQKNGVTVATITFAAGSATGTFSVQAAVTFAVGDKFRIVAPAVADATLADIDFTLLATLS
jgi:hypothetical protein